MVAYLILTFIVWLAYGYTVKSGFVIDDVEGIENYDGKLKKFDYGHFSKWIIFKAFGKRKHLHHLLSIILHNLCVVSLFFFLQHFLSVKVAFLSSVLFALHPITHQGVAWVSGRGYSIGLLFALSSINLYFSTSSFHSHPLLFLVILTICSLFYYVAVNAQFTLLMTPIVLFVLGLYPLAFLFTLISLYLGKGIVKEVIEIRTKTFKEQNLGHTTFVKLSKIPVALKTLAYYTFLILFPKRLGLYHTYHYNYTKETEKFDGMSASGLFIVILCGLLFFFGDTTLKLAVTWYLAYFIIFLNWITIQQFIAERYAHIASIGLFILSAYCLQYFLLLYIFIIGLLLMRTWTQLPAYENETTFYQSNIWNFPMSDTAYANLGVAYLRNKCVGAAMDCWVKAANINPEYDVAYYNLASCMKQSGNLPQAFEYLKKAVNSPQCHFKELWSNELKDLGREMEYAKTITDLENKLGRMAANPQLIESAKRLHSQLEELNKLHIRFEEERQRKIAYINMEYQRQEQQLNEFKKMKLEAEKSIDMAKFMNARYENLKIIQEGVENLLNDNLKT